MILLLEKSYHWPEKLGDNHGADTETKGKYPKGVHCVVPLEGESRLILPTDRALPKTILEVYLRHVTSLSDGRLYVFHRCHLEVFRVDVLIDPPKIHDWSAIR